MTGWHVRGVLFVLTIAAGCSREAPRPQTAEQLKGRLEAANGITNSTEKNAALKAVAEDAADAGAADVAAKAAEGITQSTTRNEVAEACARKLARRGDTSGAKAVAELITNTTKKNEVLGEIARGSP